MSPAYHKRIKVYAVHEVERGRKECPKHRIFLRTQFIQGSFFLLSNTRAL